jgi:eukaryotic-like serine/threonine-protein kinase
LLGTYIGNYRLVTELGGGAMGDVYFAEHALMGRRAAIKIIREDLSRDSAVIERFVNEARAVNAIKHPNIVEITDFGQLGSRYYLIMELLEGETLEARLERQPRLPEGVAIRVAAQVCDALSAAHAVGIVHRDLKPENIFLVNTSTGSELVKVLDFGVAKLSQWGGRPDVTTPGMLLGTPHYMSPEQCRGDLKLDHRSDIYALGIVLYRILAGVLPLDSEDLLQLLFAHLNQTPRNLRELAPEISSKTEAAVMRALRKTPSERFANMRAMRSALLDEAPADESAAQPLPAPIAVALPGSVEPARAASPTPAKQPAHKATPSRHFPAVSPPEPATPARQAAAAAVAAVKAPAHKPSSRQFAAVQPPAGPRGQAPVRQALQQSPAPQPVAELAMSNDVEPLAPTDKPPPLHKPADPAALNRDSSQPRRVGNRLAKIVLERLNSGRLQLPTLSNSAVRCLEQLRETNVSSARLAETLARDPLLASQVIRRANSVLVSGSARVRSLEVAIGRLGALQLRSLVMELSTRQLFESRNPAIRHAFQELWDHALAVATVAQQLAVRCAGASPDVAYLAGLLHDIGKPVIAAVLLEAERQASKSADQWLNADNWLEIVADCHREVGVATARAWLLPDEIVHAIARSNRFTPEGRTATANLVCFANALAKDQGVYAGSIDADEVRALVRQGQDLYGVSDDQLLAIRASIRRKRSG